MRSRQNDVYCGLLFNCRDSTQRVRTLDQARRNRKWPRGGRVRDRTLCDSASKVPRARIHAVARLGLEDGSPPARRRRFLQIKLYEFIADRRARTPFDAIANLLGGPGDGRLARVGDNGHLASDRPNGTNLVLAIDELLERGWKLQSGAPPYRRRRESGKVHRPTAEDCFCLLGDKRCGGGIAIRSATRRDRVMECARGWFVTRKRS